MSGADDLSGPWYGHYAGEGQASGFIALIADAGGALDGTVSEPDDTGFADLRRATLSGRRDGGGVAFTKQYDGDVYAHAVDYRGTLSGDGQVISGEWTLDGVSGGFTMEREVFRHEELEDEREAPIEVGDVVGDVVR